VAKDAIGALRDILVTNWSKPPEPSIEDIADLDKGDAKRVRMLDNDVIRIFETAHNEAQPELIYDYVNEHVNITIDCRTVDSRERLSEMRDEVRRIIHAFRKGDNNNFDRLIYKTRTDLSDRSKKLFRYTLQCEIITFSLLATAVDPVVNPADGSVSGANTFQSYDGDLTTLAAMTPSDSVFIVGNGVNWVAESGATARTSLGLGTIATQDSDDVSITGGSINGVAIGTSTTGVVYSITANTGITANQAAGAVTLNVGGLTVSELAANSLQVSSESFADNDTSLMTSAAIQDKILSYGYAVLADITSGVDLTAGTGMLIQSETNTASGDYSATITIDLKDEDNMASNSATHAASQQSIKAYVDNEVTSLIDSAPGALDTLNELAAAINDDASYFSTINTALGNRIRADASQSFTTTQKAQARTNIGLNAGSVPTAGTGIDISGSGEFSVDVSDFMSNGSNDRILTSINSDTFQGEEYLTFSPDGNSGGAVFSIDKGAGESFIVKTGGTNTLDAGYTTLEMGGDVGARIDLKSPESDDFDIRIHTTGNGGEIVTASPLTFKTSNNNDDITFDPHGTGKVAFNSGGNAFTFPTDRGSSGQVLKTGAGGVIAWGTDENDNHTYAISSATVTGGANLVLTAGGSGSGTDTVKLAGGTNTTVSQESDVITIVSSDTTYSTNSSTSGSDARINLVAGGSGSGTDYITIAGGSNVQIAETGDTITISSTTATTYDLLVAQTLGDNNDPVLRLDPSTGSNDDITITGGSNVTVTRNSGTQLTIASTDTNTQNVFATSFVDSSNDALLRLTKSGASSGTQDVKFVAGANITLTPNTGTSPQQLTIAGVPSANDATITLTAGTGLSGGGNFTTDQAGNETLTFNVDTGTIATKSYVDGLKQGLDTKDSVRVATTANITRSGTQTIDGVSVQANDRVLVKDQSDGSENGIYVASASGWSRASDADADVEVTAGLYVWVEEGTVNGDQGWILTTNDDITLDSTSLTFTQFTGTGQITAGTGLSKSGNTLNVGSLGVAQFAGAAVQTSSEVSSFGNNDTSFLTAAGIKNYIEANSFGFLQSVAVANIAGSAIQTGSESFADNDTTIMTSAAVQDKILSYGYTTNTGDITGVDLTVTSPITIASETNTGSGSYSATLGLADPATLTQLTESTDATDDKIILWDESASSWKYMTIDDLQDSIDTGGAGGIAFDGSTANGVLTYKDADEASVESTLTYDPSGLLAIYPSSGYGRIEMGGSSGAYIDLKNNSSDDFDVRLITDGTGLDIVANGAGNHITLKTNGTQRVKVEDAQTFLNTTNAKVGYTGQAGKMFLSADATGSYLYWNATGTDITLAADDDLTLHADDDMFFQTGGATKLTLNDKGELYGSDNRQFTPNSYTLGVADGNNANKWIKVCEWIMDGSNYDSFSFHAKITQRGNASHWTELLIRGEFATTWWTKAFTIHGPYASTAQDTFLMVFDHSSGGSDPKATLYFRNDQAWNKKYLQVIQNVRHGDNIPATSWTWYNTTTGSTTTPATDGEGNSSTLSPAYFRTMAMGLGGGSDTQYRIYDGITATPMYLHTANQRVGIGTASPDDTLHLKGTDGGTSLLVEDTGSSSNPAVEIKTDSHHWKLQARGADSDKLRIVEGNNVHMVVKTDGKVGIGNTAPTTKLHISDNAEVSLSVDSSHITGSQISLDATATGGDEWRLISAADNAGTVDGTGAFGLYNIDASAYRLVVEGTTGNVGIGTTTPATKLHIERSESDAENLMLRLRDSTVNALGERIGIEGFWNTVPAGDIEFELTNVSSGAAAIVFSPHSGSSTKNEAMRIASDGYVGIGTSSPANYSNGGRGLHINDATLPELRLTNDTTGTASGHGSLLQVAGEHFYIWNAEAADIKFATSAAVKMTLNSAGKLGIGETAPLFPLHLKYTDNRTDPEGSGSSSGAGAIGANAQGGGLYIENESTTDGSWAGVTFRTDTADARIAYKSVGSSLVNEGQMSFYLDTNDSNDDVFTLQEVLRLRGGNSNGSQSYNSVDLPVNDARLRLGASQQLELKFDGSHTRITHNAATDSWMIFKNEDGAGIQFNIGTEKGIEINKNGNVELYYDNTKSFETTSAGGTLTGALTVTGAASAVGSLTMNYAGSDTYAEIIGPLNRDLRFILRDNGDGDGFLFRNAAGTNLLDINRTGNVTVSGDLQVSGNDIKSSGGTTALTLSGANVTVAGDLTVSGTTTTINTTNLAVEDNIVVLNSNVTGTPADVDAGIEVERGDTANATLLFDEGDNCWKSYTPDSGVTFQARNSNGYISFGPQNGTYAHISTDVSKFYLNKQIVVDSGIVSSYNEDLKLQRAMSSQEQITIADDSMTFKSANTDVMKIDGANARVGIGTTSPETTLHVDNGSIQVGLQADDYYTLMTNNAFAFHRASASYIDQRIDNGDIRFRMNAANTDLMMLDGSTMRVGIGTTSPGFTLDVTGTFQAQGDHDGNVIIDNTGTDQVILASHTGSGTPVPWDIREASSTTNNGANYGPLNITRMNMDADGAGSNIHFRTKKNNGSAQEVGGIGATIDTGLTANATVTGSLHFYTTDAGTGRQEKMTIKSDGNVGIGVTSPQHKLDIDGNLFLGKSGESTALTGGPNLTLQGDSALATFKSDNASSGDQVAGIRVFADGYRAAGMVIGDYDNSDGSVTEDWIFGRQYASNHKAGIMATPENGGDEYVTVQSHSQKQVIIAADSDDIDFLVRGTGGTYLFGEASTSRVGIGTTSPAAQLHVGSTAYEVENGIFLTGSHQRAAKMVIHADDANTDWDEQEIGLALHNEDPTNNNWSPHIAFTTHEDDDGNPANANPVAVAAISATYNTRNANSWASGALVFFTNDNDGNVERMRIAEDGQVLVQNNGIIRANGSGYLQLGNTSGGDIRVFGDGSSSRIQAHGNSLYLQTNRDTDDIIFATNAGGTDGDSTVVEAMRIHGPDGNVGIGNSSPSSPLDVTGSIELSSNLHFNGAGGHYIKHEGGTASTDNFTFRFSDNEDVMIVRGDGRVGIKTTSPSHPLHVVGDTYVQSGDIHISQGAYKIKNASNGNQAISFPSSGNLLIEGVNTEFQGNVTSTGVFVDKNSRVVGASSQVLDVQWTVGTGSDTNGYFDFVQNGNTNENSRVWGDTPSPYYPQRGILWQMTNMDAGGGDGGWTTDAFPVDHTRTYRFSVFARQESPQSGSGSMTLYFGTHGYGNTNGVVHIDNDQVSTNPYFWAGDLPETGKWYLLVGHVLGSGDTAPDTNIYGGIYDVDTGKKEANITDSFRWHTDTTTSKHRSFLFYYDDTGNTDPDGYLFGPRVDLCDGTEPPISSLINGGYFYSTKTSTMVTIANDNASADADATLRLLSQHGSDTWTDLTEDTYGNFEITGGASTRRSIMKMTDHDTTTGTLEFNREHFDWDTKIYGDSATPAIMVDGSTDRVGIYTASPVSTLQIAGDTTIYNATNEAHLVLRRDATGANYGSAIKFQFGDSGSASSGHEYARMTGNIEDSTNTAEDGYMTFSTSLAGTLAEKMRITSAGKVGIGTDTPPDTMTIEHATAPILGIYRNTNVASLSAGDVLSKIAFRKHTGNSGNTTVELYNVHGNSGTSDGVTDDYHTSDFRIATRKIGTANLTDRFTILGQEGYVGIGTTSPEVLLHVKGDTYIQSATANQLLRIHADTNSSPAPRIEMMRGTHDTWGTGDNYNDWRIENVNHLKFYSGTSSVSSGAAVERFEILSDGSGITNNNAYVIPGTAGSAGQVLKWPSSGTVLEWAADGGDIDTNLNLANNPTWTVTTTSGIGLEITRNQSASNMDNDLVRIRDDSQYSDQAVLRLIHDGFDQMQAADHSKVTGALVAQSTDDTIQWPVTVANAKNANSDGYGVGIKLKLSGWGNEDETDKWAGIGARGDDSSNWGRPTGMMFWTRSSTTSGTTPTEKMYLDGGGQLGIGVTAPSHIIHVNGQGRATNSAWATSSDMRVKENIVELDSSLDVINSLRPVKFDYIDGAKDQINFIAQEFKEVIPDAVTLTEEQGLDDFHVLDTSMLVPMLVKAVQELTAKVEELEARLDG